MKTVSKFFYSKASLPVCLLVTVFCFGYLYWVLMPNALSFALPGQDAKSLGTSFGFNLATVQGFFKERNATMHAAFSTFNLVWDSIFALVYGLMYVLWFSLLFKKNQASIGIFNLFPFLQSIFDLVENNQLASLSQKYLQGGFLDVQIASIASKLKWVCSGLIFLGLLYGIYTKVKSRIKG